MSTERSRTRVFLVTYTDGTTVSFTQSISDWAFPQGHAGESMALMTGYRNTFVGEQQAGGFRIYVYTFALDPNKVVRSLTLPVNANVEVLAASVVPRSTTPVDLSSAFNQTGAVGDGTAFDGGGLTGLVMPFVQPGRDEPDGQWSDVPARPERGQCRWPGDRSAGGSGKRAEAAGHRSQWIPAESEICRDLYRRPDDHLHAVDQRLGLSDGYSGESTALTTTYRDSSDGSPQAGQFRLYAYTFSLDPSKVVQSLTLPKNANVEVFAASVVPGGSTQADLSSAFNRTGVVSDGASFTDGGLDNGGTAFSASQVGASLTAGGATFHLGSQVVSAAGQVIPLPAVPSDTLKLLATGVNGSQPDQTFVVTYTDGSKATFTQSVSDWAFPMGYSGRVLGIEHRLPGHICGGTTGRPVPHLCLQLLAGPDEGGPEPDPAEERQP